MTGTPQSLLRRYCDVMARWTKAMVAVRPGAANSLYAEKRGLTKELAATVVTEEDLRRLLGILAEHSEDAVCGITTQLLDSIPAVSEPVLNELASRAKHGHTRANAWMVLDLWRKGELTLD